MSILPALLDFAERKLRERTTIAALRRLTPRQLADVGLEPVHIPMAARLAARPESAASALPSLLERSAGGGGPADTTERRVAIAEPVGLTAIGNGLTRRHLALGA